ncbi:Arf family guanine nucleotide exchange factor SEC7 [Sugiyamaella lignohabitans]|uniref:Arf family guanine nucleotide exchange factor SEC7 n=1 Tax=Sugiyamaella lignohabitans TaxID=796027 RepID=A0A167F5H8_9ASCO|nr:Arf family guanine nucleotide exchange factor SEC7 [Sugiyamaella lignohabitans]ANB14853.1 Arf family guanine nucleotide exchange factor SEC7 [Sugiyamaella lignohabitans]
MLCLSSLAKNPKYQKTSLHAVDLLRKSIKRIAPLKKEKDAGIKDEYTELWFPILFSLHDIIMNGEDLEVRSRALNYMFDILVEYGGQFEPSFWDSICRKLLFPIFVVLKSRSSKTQDELSVWLSTTMIQALRNMIALLTHYFETLERMLDGFLELLVTCIDQENDTVSRIGSSCVLQLVIQNVEKLSPQNWSLIVDKLEYLFKTTTAHELIDNSLLRESEVVLPSTPPTSSSENGAANGGHSRNGSKDEHANHGEVEGTSPTLSPTKHKSKNGKKPSRFRATIVRSILQLLMIDTVEELLNNPEVFKKMPTDDILRLSGHLKASYLFARKFNDNRELRLELWRQGFMKQLPNLLKQESTSALTYVGLMMRLYKDDSKLENGNRRDEVEIELIPLCVEIIKGYNHLVATDERYVNTLSPVVVQILDEYSGFKDNEFEKNIHDFYPEVVKILGKDLSPELRAAVQKVLTRLGELKFT